MKISMNSQTSANHGTKHFLSFGTEGVESTVDCAKCAPNIALTYVSHKQIHGNHFSHFLGSQRSPFNYTIMYMTRFDSIVTLYKECYLFLMLGQIKFRLGTF